MLSAGKQPRQPSSRSLQQDPQHHALPGDANAIVTTLRLMEQVRLPILDAEVELEHFLYPLS